MASDNRGKAPAQPADLQLWTRYSAGAQVRTNKACQGRCPEPAEPERSVQAEGKGM